MKFNKSLLGTIFVSTSLFFSASTLAGETSAENFVADSLSQFMAEVDAELDMSIVKDVESINHQLSVIKSTYVATNLINDGENGDVESEHKSEVKVEKAE